MKSLWTKFLTGIAVAGTLIGITASASAGGNKGLSFGGGGGGGGGGSSMRAFSGNSGSQSMKSFSARSLSGNGGGNGNSLKFKSFNASGSSLGRTLNLNQNQFKARSLGGLSGNNQFQNLSKNLKTGNRQIGQNLGSQILGNSNQLKGLGRVGQFNPGQNGKLLDQMFRSARTFEAGKGLGKVNGLQGLVGGQFGNKQFNAAKFNGLNKHANFFGGSFHQHSNKSAFCKPQGWCGWGWNNWCAPVYYKPWCYNPCYDPCYYGYPYYGCYPYYGSPVTYVTPVVAPIAQPVAPVAEQAPQLPLADLVLADLRVMEPGNGADLGPLFQITIANQGPAASPPSQASMVAAVSKEQLDSAVKATTQVGPIEPSQKTTVEIRLPVEALAIPGPNGPVMFELLGVVLDELNQVDELDEKNNRGLVNRDKIRPIEGMAAPQAATNPSLAARSANPPAMISLPPQ